jgi:tetratricopeptide (TPR) repeat protein
VSVCDGRRPYGGNTRFGCVNKNSLAEFLRVHTSRDDHRSSKGAATCGSRSHIKVDALQQSNLLAISLILTLSACAASSTKPLSGASSRGASLGTSQDTAAGVAQLDAALQLIAEKHLAEGEIALQTVISAKYFGGLASEDQYRALEAAAQVALVLKHTKLEYESRTRLLSLPQATADDRWKQVYAAARLGYTAEVLTGFTVFVKQNPDRLNDSYSPFIIRLFNDAKTLPHGSLLPLLQALYGAHWKLRWNIEPSFAWHELALLLVENDRLTDAIDVSTHVTDSYELIAMRADRRFDAVVAAIPAQFDIDAAATRELQSFQAASENSPKSLELKISVIELLQRQQHYSAMLALADSVLSEVRSTNYPEQLYEDYEEHYLWILNHRSIALRRRGRWDEAVAQLTEASLLAENHGGNVSQLINLGYLYCRLGRPRDALEAVGRVVGKMSPNGMMQMEGVRLDAASQLGDPSQVASSLQYLEIHRADAPESYWDALVLVNQPDHAAQFLIERLRDGDQRAAALLSIQDFASGPRTRREIAFDTRRNSVLARKDVQAAIRQVGRIESFHIEAEPE